MKTLLRMSGVVFVIALLAFAVVGLRHTGVPSDVLNAVRDRDDLKQWQESIWRYRENQYQAVQDWLDERCTLAETMQRFQELDREYAKAWPAFPNLVQQRLPQSDQERHYLLILGRVEIILHERPEELAAARRRLEKEYQQLQVRCPKLETVR